MSHLESQRNFRCHHDTSVIVQLPDLGRVQETAGKVVQFSLAACAVCLSQWESARHRRTGCSVGSAKLDATLRTRLLAIDPLLNALPDFESHVGRLPPM
jgi:hypothetical protein